MKKIDYIDILNADLHVLYSQICTCQPSWRWNSLKNEWEGTVLWMVTDGRGNMTTPVGEFSLQAGACFCIPMDEEFIASHDPERPLSVIAVHFLSNALQKRLDRHCLVTDLSTMRALLERVYNQWQLGNQETAAFWLRTGLMALVDTLAPASDDDRDFMELRTRIQNSPEALYDLSEIAARHGYSLDHFIRKFKSVTGRTPGQFVIDARIAKAKELLMLSSLGVGDISRMLGYRDQYFFSRQFRQRVGMSPVAYRGNR